MNRKGGFKNLKLGKNVYRQMKRRGAPDNVRTGPQPKPPAKKANQA
jgi:hypothetical protein